MLLFSPGITHQWLASTAGCRFLVLCFDLDPPVHTPPEMLWPVHQALCWEVQLLFDDIQAAEPGWAEQAHCRLGVLYSRLLHLFTSKPPPPAQPAIPHLVERIDAVLEQHLAKVLTLEELAIHFSMSARHLTLQFRALTGMTSTHGWRHIGWNRLPNSCERPNSPSLKSDAPSALRMPTISRAGSRYASTQYPAATDGHICPMRLSRAHN